MWHILGTWYVTMIMMIVLWFSSSPSPLLLLGPEEDIRGKKDEKRLLGKIN